jgi:hypothetical protein
MAVISSATVLGKVLFRNLQMVKEFRAYPGLIGKSAWVDIPTLKQAALIPQIPQIPIT